jgi:hypothetical protein
MPDYPKYKLANGETIQLVSLHIAMHSLCSLGALEGSYEGIRRGVLVAIQDEAKKIYGQTGIFTNESKVAHGKELLRINLPPYTTTLLLKGKPLTSKGVFSKLVAVFFSNALPVNLPEEIALQVGTIDDQAWKKAAKDVEPLPDDCD